MPERPRSHVLEDESFDAFKAALPPVWVFRPGDRHDYGIDGEVEIFTAEGDRTGKRFFVQLRATDSRDLRKALVTRFPVRTTEYYRSLDAPLLVVRYLSQARELYARWFHSFDPHYGGKNKKTLTFRLRAQDRWGSQTPEDLVREVDAFRRFRSARLETPVLLHVLAEDGASPPSEVLLPLRRLAGEVPSIIALTNLPPSPGDTSLVIGRREIAVRFGEAASVTIHYEHEAPSQPDLVAHDAMTTAALGIHVLGHPHLASQVAQTAAGRSTFILSPDVALALSSSFQQARHLVASLELAEALHERTGEEATMIAGFFTLPLLMVRPRLTPTEQAAYEAFLRRRIARGTEVGTGEASARYTLANFLRTTGRLAEAFREYRRAARADPEYERRPYFCRELASTLFLLGHYGLAASILDTALMLGDDPRTHALRGEALFFVGELASAAHEFERFFESEAPDRPLARLEHAVVEQLRGRFGDSFVRSPDAANELAGISASLEERQIEQQMAQALELDPLCGLAWFNLGVHLKEVGRQEDGLFPFLVASLVEQSDVEAWVNAIAICLTHASAANFTEAVVSAGYGLNGETLVAQFRELIYAQPPGFPAEEVFAEFEHLLALVPQEEAESELRMVGEGSPEYFAIHFSSDF